MKLILYKRQKVFFTSDSHYDHANLCSATSNWSDSETRKFDSLADMNDTIVDGINSVVGENDILIHFGDWSFGGFENIKIFRDRIKCKNIHLIEGNHDKFIRKNKDNVRSLFLSVHEYLALTIVRKNEQRIMEKHRFVCMHYPIASWNGLSKGVMHLHGHIHSSKEHRLGPGRSLDVGCDGNDYIPYSLDDVLELLKDRPIKHLSLKHDHHEED